MLFEGFCVASRLELLLTLLRSCPKEHEKKKEKFKLKTPKHVCETLRYFQF